MACVMTINPPGFRTFALIAAGFALKFLSGRLELAGDLSAAAGTRLGYHVSALVLLIAAFGCFAWAFKMIFFDKPAAPPADIAAPEKTLEPVDIYPETFDPDAALARYMSRRGDPDDPAVPKPGGFGRKGV
jgi:hypothetical protein